ncbi:MAG: LysR family transcriptional regulator, partial [Ruminiclostridium sp.]
MNLLHLKYAAEIELTGSINKAAKSLYIAQPNLSRGIKELESTLGITIFKRTSKGMVPTAEGEEFLRYAKEILSQIDEVEELYKNGKKISLKFSISVPRASYITEAFAQFSNKIESSKPVEIFYMETNAMRTVSNVASAD